MVEHAWIEVSIDWVELDFVRSKSDMSCPKSGL